jgi:hypothetical protein
VKVVVQLLQDFTHLLDGLDFGEISYDIVPLAQLVEGHPLHVATVDVVGNEDADGTLGAIATPVGANHPYRIAAALTLIPEVLEDLVDDGLGIHLDISFQCWG